MRTPSQLLENQSVPSFVKTWIPIVSAEPGSPEEIQTFCSTNYGVTFPMTEKVEVNGSGRHPLYETLTAVVDDEGNAGDIQWNFEKFLVAPDGEIVHRFRPMTTPDSDEVVSAIEAVLPG